VLVEDQDIYGLLSAKIADTCKKKLIWAGFKNLLPYSDAPGVQLCKWLELSIFVKQMELINSQKHRFYR
jgi:hypothetical protein